MQVVLIQAELQQSATTANRAHLTTLMDQHGADVDLFVLPETFATGFLGDGEREPEALEGPSFEWMQQQARARRSAICGSLIIAENGQRFNRFVYVDAEGQRLAIYDKRHLFGYGGEDQRYTAGRQRVVFADQGWRICPQICYDLRFPVWCRNQHDYDVLLFVANWPIKRVSAWQHLLRARAIENQAYVIGVNRAGPDGSGTIYGGCSGVYDPLGVPLVEMGHEPGSARVAIERERLQAVREQLPFLADADPFALSDIE
ncbi:MAG: amidohydrolase [Wenzhouxiangellaceae bacterium]